MKKGFTLVELLASITLLAILSMVAIPHILKKIDIMKEKTLENLVATIEESTIKYVLENREEVTELDEIGFVNIGLKTLIDLHYIEGNLENSVTGKKIAVDDVVYVTLNSKNVVAAKYDPYQKDNPKVILLGKKNIRLKRGTAYIEYGAIARDKFGSDITSQITIDSNVNMSIEGEYSVFYSVPNAIVVERCVTVTSDFISNDIEKPILSSNIPNNLIETNVGVSITMPVVKAVDNVDGTINNIAPSYNNVNINQTGTYKIKYNYTDSSGNKATTLVVTVIVKP